MRSLSTLAVLGVTAVTTATVAVIGVAAAVAQPGEGSPTETNGGSIVEDFSYPGAAAILETHGVKLISGDGHIVFADCSTPPEGDIGLIRVRSTKKIGATGNGLVCFRVLASTGHLKLELPAVYEIRGDGQRPGTGHEITAEVTTEEGERTVVPVNPSGSTQVGIGISPDNDPTTLLELNVTG